MADEQTLNVYARRARDYADRFKDAGVGNHLREFMDALPPKARVLDLGCGPGTATAALLAAGHDVDAWDASPEMAEVGHELHGLKIRVAAFDALSARAEYDAIYANFSLLHAPKSDMPDHLARIARALKPGGLVHIGLKTGDGEKRDALGRFYAYYTDHEITGLLKAAGLRVETRSFGKDPGLDGTVAPWIILKARKDD